MFARRLPLLLGSALLLSIAPVAAQQDAPAENPDIARYVTPPPEIERILRTDKNYAELDYLSPDGAHFLVPLENELSTLELMSKETYRLAELELRPQTDRLWHLDTYGIYDIRFYSMAQRRFVEVDVPDDTFLSDFTWSPDGSRIAFLAHLPSHTEVWTADPATGRASSLSDARVLATVGTSAGGQGNRPSNMLQWTPEGTLITLLVPEDRGPEPARNRIPDGPVTRHTRGEPTGSPTYPNLLEDEHDARLFEFYTTAQIAELAEGRAPRPIGEPGMVTSIQISPDGDWLMVDRMHRPFSYIASYRSFPTSSTLVSVADGTVVQTLSEQPLREGRGGFGGGGGGNGPRSFAWRPDGAGLTFLQRAERAEGAPADAPRPDRVMLATAPAFDLDAASVVIESADPIASGVTWSLDAAHAFASVRGDDGTSLVHWTVGGSNTPDVLLPPNDSDDPTDRPGDLWTRLTGNGIPYAMVTTDGDATWLEGDGLKADFRPQPFVDRVAFDGSITRVFEGARDSFDRPLAALDDDLEQMIVSRESKSDFPDSFLWSMDGGWGDNLTENVDPFPEITAARRLDFSFTRTDGLEVQGRVSLPVGYREGDRVPAIFWTYPREFEQAEQYTRSAIGARNHNAFTHMSWLRWSDMWLAAGYALVYPDIPIIGENYNDTYIASLIDAMYGAIRAVDGLGVIDIDRIGHGGHSYGAFATANILANAPFFKAGIAGDGAYNRSLTPDGFQAERRSIWEAPSTYIEMSPFFRADQIETPLLIYHGGDDNNTGTFPVQSRRLISALTILGKTAVLYEYPYESHTPRAIENKLDMWARFVDWFDRYVKDADTGTSAIVSDGEGPGGD
ncbi:prolyl oligopeptidase family serine peptidase [Gemmatimonadota bacterium DH-20]|uniref:Prolyl oligopeptidase family serine peptidase n=1 Tax=Gaopeijia maritima TaxID=3119007 RepID=A0ABU9E9M3_9BACT